MEGKCVHVNAVVVVCENTCIHMYESYGGVHLLSIITSCYMITVDYIYVVNHLAYMTSTTCLQVSSFSMAVHVRVSVE